ncbi:FAD binding domain-containing [Pyrenophora seminiperda CCB06]|uniref:FAD binding domain-containing n=1 Tax=Pyrenophora seminiperda CCB06 TaxID=1302712 RepID=A0A3M7MFY8_9PLEO|nr:FAD binding domain-containing [Pyrenophora seminiperda CCB06]
MPANAGNGFGTYRNIRGQRGDGGIADVTSLPRKLGAWRWDRYTTAAYGVLRLQITPQSVAIAVCNLHLKISPNSDPVTDWGSLLSVVLLAISWSNKMWAWTIVYAVLLSTGILAEDIFETSDFNVADTLLKNGVDISTIPELANRSADDPTCFCSCKPLQRIFGDDKVESRGSLAYSAIINSFWSHQQQDPNPSCIFRPEEARDVSTLVLLSRLMQCPFSVKSGGHAAFAGASSADGGITVVFERMKQITFSEDKKIATIEPGNVWHDVYSTLEKENLAVIGGRVGDIGVGGLVTGGGISWFANLQGWACDNVASYEVVTASGRIVDVTPTEFPDLYWALRGGGNNFGIVTKFHLNTFAHGLMLGGTRMLLEPSFPATIDAFVNIGMKAADDPKAQHYMAAVLVPSSNTKILAVELEYADPVPDPPIFEEYRNISAASDTMHINTLAYFTEKLMEVNPTDFRESYWTASCKLDKGMVQYIMDVWFEEFDKLLNVSDILPSCVFQIITVPQMEQMAKNGGNALGLDPSDGPLILINLATRWSNPKDDVLMHKAHANVIRKMQEEAELRGLGSKYLYMNYASEFQDVIASYGYENVAKLRHIALKYDPTEVFQKLQPGYFKLHGPPNPNWP